MRIRTLIVDEDVVLNQEIRTLLAQDPEIEFGSECKNAEQMEEALLSFNPKLCLINPAMPGSSRCFNLITESTPGTMRVIVAIATDARHAMEAFDADVFAYLMRPLSRSRFLAVVERAKAYLRGQQMLEREGTIFLPPPVPFADSDRVVLRSEGKFVFLAGKEIDWIEAAGNYVRVYAGGKTYLQRHTMGMLARKLNPTRFLRIHKSVIVNVDKIKEVQPWHTGEYIVVMQNGKELTLSRGYRTLFWSVVGDLGQPRVSL